MSYPCTSCGACCRKSRPLAVSMPVTESGDCVHLMSDGQCEIYDERPDLCRVDLMGERMFPTLTEKEHHGLIAFVCNTWVAEDKLPSEYFVVLKE